MAEIDDIGIGFNRALVSLQLHHAGHAGAGQVASFHVDVDRALANVLTKYDNLAASTGVDVTAAKSAATNLAGAVKSAAASAGKVEPPAAAA